MIRRSGNKARILEELTVEEIPPKPFPPTKANLQSCSSWRQAKGKVFDEAGSEVHRSKITGSSASKSTQRWEKDGRSRR